MFASERMGRQEIAGETRAEEQVMSGVVFRRGKRVILRPLERSDGASLRRWMNDLEIAGRVEHLLPMTEADVDDWFGTLSRSKSQLAFGIVAAEKQQLVGTVALYGINWQHRTATTGATVGERDYWGHGYGTEAKMLLIEYAFNGLDLHVLLARVSGRNQQGIAHARRCGYEQVGCIPEWYLHHGGERSDQLVFVLTQERWRSLRQPNAS